MPQTSLDRRLTPAALAISALFVPLGRAGAQAHAESLSVERIFSGSTLRSAPMPAPLWLRDGHSALSLRANAGGGTDIIRTELGSGVETVLVGAEALKAEDGARISVEEITLSPDEAKALLFHNSVRVWRQNTRGVYHLLDLATKRLSAVSSSAGLQMFAKFSPDGRQIAFVRDNDLWVAPVAGGAGSEQRLTTDGSADIINGTTDWVYEEELGLRDAFRWSPDSRRIAYWRFDQSRVPVYPMVDALPLYPTVTPLRYPKAGQPNSRIRTGVIDLASRQTRWLDVTADSSDYIARMDWVDADSLVVQRLPRRQNRIDLLMVSATTGSSRRVLIERDSAWVDVNDGPLWVANATQFLWASSRDGWRQYYLYGRDGSLVRKLTRGGADASAIAGVDQRIGAVYVVEADPRPMERQLYRYSLARAGERVRLTTGGGTHRVSLSRDGGMMVDVYATIGRPPSATLRDLPSGAMRRTLVDNRELESKLSVLSLRPPEFIRIPIPSGDTLNAYRLVPAGFDSTKKYPVLMYVYGGPGSQTVTDDWGGSRYLWHQMLAQKGYVVVSVDNRGTGARGRRFETLTYLHLGRYEAQDQIDAARWLAARSWVDGGRIGIWGWSYGGYMSSLAAGIGGSVFRAAIAVAPVTDWRLYDTIYTERYMWIPQENAEGYRESAPQQHVGTMSASFLLVHGTGDDNVHPQNSLQLADRLQAAGKPFQLMLYPNRTHSIAGGNTQTHLFDMLTRFVLEKL
ncbi:MAG: S9 family peptidase [Gemmatimonadota bacterium]|nr:S9 family peptidase [Gemmatimonadota bacterium]